MWRFWDLQSTSSLDGKMEQTHRRGFRLRHVLSYFGVAKGLNRVMAGGFNVGRIFASQNKIIFAQKQLDF